MKKSISVFLILTLLLSFCIFSFPVGAVASEVIIIGGTIAALAAATGAFITVDNMTDNELSQYLYDRFVDFGNRIQQDNIIAYAIAGTAIEKGRIKLSNGVSELLSRFISEDLNQVNTSFSTIEVNNVNIYLPRLQFYQTNGLVKTGFINNPNELIWYNLGNTITIGSSTLRLTTDKKLYINGSLYSPSSSSSIQNYISNYNVQYIKGDFRNKYALCLNKNASNNNAELTIIIGNNSYSNPVQYTDIAGTYAQSMYTFAAQLNQPVNNHNFQTDAYIELPSETLNPENNTYITISGVDSSFTLEQAAASSLTQTIEGSIESSFENKNNLDPIAPETNQDWITSFHGIWYYVEYLIDKASEGFQFFGNLISSMPEEISFCFLGAFVLLLFGGVISRLLL